MCLPNPPDTNSFKTWKPKLKHAETSCTNLQLFGKAARTELPELTSRPSAPSRWDWIYHPPVSGSVSKCHPPHFVCLLNVGATNSGFSRETPVPYNCHVQFFARDVCYALAKKASRYRFQGQIFAISPVTQLISSLSTSNGMPWMPNLGYEAIFTLAVPVTAEGWKMEIRLKDFISAMAWHFCWGGEIEIKLTTLHWQKFSHAVPRWSRLSRLSKS